MQVTAAQQASRSTAVLLQGIGKRFGGAQALRDINLTIGVGEIHALVGANGAGKSTLGKIIGGYYTRDEGLLTVFGAPMGQWSAARALASGIAMIHQEIQLVPGLSVADNVFLGLEQRAFGLFRGSNRERYLELDAEVGFRIPPDLAAGKLPLATQQKVEILRALARNARVIIMDEPTAALSAEEADRLHAVMKDLARKGRSVIYVTHFLDHVLSQCDRVTVLRDGEIVVTRDIAGLDKPQLVQWMLGRSFTATFPERRTVRPDAKALLDVRELAAGAAVESVSLSVREGEIVGLLGLMGSGRSEVLRAIYGADVRTGGEITFDGAPLRTSSPQESIARNLVMIPEDRRRQGLVMTQTVRNNMTLPYLQRFSRLGVIRSRAELASVEGLMKRFAIAPNDPQMTIRGCSGGNQQKVLLARWLINNPRLILLDEPTRGVDIGARQAIYQAIAAMAHRGMGVLLVSSDLEEVLGLAHRCYLISAGRTLAEIDPTIWSVELVMKSLFQVAPVEANPRP